MNATFLAQQAYGNRRAPTRSDRAIEYDAFSHITSALKKATTFPELAEAIDQNRRLWTILATSLASEDNKLPAETRAGLLSLANFTFKHSQKVLSKQADVDALVEINGTIMKGLRGTKAAAP